MKKCYIETNNGICYNANRQNDVNRTNWSNENPRDGSLWGFLFRLGGPSLQAGCLMYLSVQPFANEVGSNTCYDR